MKTRICIATAFASVLLPLAASANGLEDLLSNPDNVMLRKPAPKAAVSAAPAADASAKKAAEEAAAKKAAEAAEAAAAKKAAEEAAAKKAAEAAEAAAAKKAEEERKAAEMKRLREQVAAEKAAREQAEAARRAAEAQAKAEKKAAEKAESDRVAAEARAAKALEEKAGLEKRAAYLANPDPDERPAPKKRLEAKGDQPDVTEGAPDVKVQVEKKGKKKLTGRSAVITADRTDYDRKEGVILFDRNVYVDDEQYQMHAERMFVFLDGTNDLKRLVAIGNVAITNDAKAAGCSRAVYTKAASRIVLYGDDRHPAWLRDAGGKKGDASEVRGKRITYWFDSETATVEGATIEMPGIKGGAKDIFDGPSRKADKDKKKAE